MSGPFAGLTVVEVGQFVVVPVCAMHLADGGAEVIKIEPIRGDAYRKSHPVVPGESRQFMAKNRGKQSLGLALGAPGARDVVERLVAMADVLLVNISPAAITKHGLGYEDVRAINPRLIYGGASAFGYRGADADLPGMDGVAQARSGLIFSFGAERDGVPHHSEVMAADYAASMLLFGGVVSALYARERTGLGQKVEVSLLGGALALQGNALVHLDAQDTWRREFIDETLPMMRTAGGSLAELDAARDHLRPDKVSTRQVMHRVVRTKDGYLAIGAGSDGAKASVYAVTGVEPTGDSGELLRRLDEAFVAEVTAHWVSALRERGVPAAELRHVDEMLFDEHCIDEGLILADEHPALGRYRALGPPFRLSGTPMAPAPPSPAFASHSSSILRRLGYSTDEITELVDTSAVAVSGASSGVRGR